MQLNKIIRFLLSIVVFFLFSLFVNNFVFSDNDKSSNVDYPSQEFSKPRQLPKLDLAQWQPLLEMGQALYLSVAMNTINYKTGFWQDNQHLGDPWGTIGIVVRGYHKKCPIRVEISGSDFIKPSVFTGFLPDKSKIYCIYPILKYDYKKFLALKQTIPETLTFKVKIGIKKFPEQIVQIKIHPVNQCVYRFQDSSGKDKDISCFFASYVNESHPITNQIMKEALATKNVDAFSGYFSDKEIIMSEIETIWQILQARGRYYNLITVKDKDSQPYISSQYVRLLEESIHTDQTDCVDSSILLASILRRIGLDVSLVKLADHMFVKVSLDQQGNDVIYIETTYLPEKSLQEAIEEGYKKYEENKDKFSSNNPQDQAYRIVNIQNSRVLGITPIRDCAEFN